MADQVVEGLKKAKSSLKQERKPVSQVVAAQKATKQIKEFVKAELRSSRVPQLMVVWDELPYNETGKLLRRVVREELSK